MVTPPTSPTKSQSPTVLCSPQVTPRVKVIRSDGATRNSILSDSGSGNIRNRTSSVHRRSSLALHHHDSVRSYISEEKLNRQKYIEKGKHVHVPWWTSKRVCLSVTCFVGFFFLYAQRVNLSVGIVCMVRSEMTKVKFISQNSNDTIETSVYNSSTNSSQNETYRYNQNANRTIMEVENSCPAAPFTEDEDSGEFSWDKPLQGLILGAFFWGYTVMQIPGGLLAERFGPRKIIAIGMITVSLITVLAPVLARGSPYLLIIGRVIVGIGEATMYPGAQVLWAKWSPPDERSRLVGFAFGGCQLGNALAFPIASLLCAYGFDGGWPSIFYILGGASLLWCVVWIIIVRDTPREMPGITDAEREHIEVSLGLHVSKDSQAKQRKKPKPWRHIFTSMPVWAILVANACGNYGAYMLLTQMPTYMKEVLNFDIKSNGLFSMIPYLAFWLVIIAAGILADFLISREVLSTEWTRKLCCSIGHFVPAIFLVTVGYMDCWHQTAAVVLLTLSMAFCGFQFASVFINHGDIAPCYAGTIFGITNTGASIPGIIAPYVVAAVTPNKTQQEWLIAFYIAALIYCVGAIFYDIFAEGEVQIWALEDEEDIKEGVDLHGIMEEDNNDDDVFKDNNTVEQHPLKT